MFGRKRSKADQLDAEVTDAETTDADSLESPDPAHADEAGASRGPYDAHEAPEESPRLDLGALRLATLPGAQVRVEVDQSSGEVSAVQVGHGESSVQLQAFAAPRSAGIWGEIRAEITEMITSSGGTVQERSGPWGPELLTRLPQEGPERRTVFAPAIFVGVDGPRWFLRAVYSGPAAVDPAEREHLDQVLATLVVVRGADPRAPREMLPMHLPADGSAADAGDAEESDEAADDFQPFERGPEITEVR